MEKIIIEKKREEITYKRVNTTVEFEVNGKKVRVYVSEDYDDMAGDDYDIDENDWAKLTDLEKEAFDDEGIWNLVRMKDSEKLEVEADIE